MGGVVAAAHADLPEAEALVERLRGAVARPDLEEDAVRPMRARGGDRLAEKRRAIAAPVVRSGDGEIEEMRLVRADHEHEVADQLAGDPHRAAVVAGAKRIGEVAARPRVRVDHPLDRDHLVEVGLAHGGEDGGRLRDRAHALLACSSRCVKATLSRRYVGRASAASTPSPAARRGPASEATAAALAWACGTLSPTWRERKSG